jgi:DNA mismatch repair protein MutS2
LAKNNPGMINARMAFDRESLQPLYKLEIGEAGESCALYIAKRLGLPQHMIERASIAAYGEEKVNPSLNEIPLNKSKQVQKSARRVKTSNVKQSPSNTAEISFTIGDSVMVYPQKEIGIVYQKANEKGEVGVQIKKKKLLINHKRLKLRVPASELYPEDYDFSIIFDTVENRKARHKLERKHDPKLIIKIKDEKDILK